MYQPNRINVGQVSTESRRNREMGFHMELVQVSAGRDLRRSEVLKMKFCTGNETMLKRVITFLLSHLSDSNYSISCGYRWLESILGVMEVSYGIFLHGKCIGLIFAPRSLFCGKF